MTLHRAPKFFARTNDAAGLTREQMMAAAPSIFADEPHESRSDMYTYIPTIDIMRKLYREGFRPMQVSQSKSRIPGKTEYTKHMVRMRHVDHPGSRNVGDVFPEAVLVNSHDGTSQYNLLAGLFRLVCSNGMITADGPTASVKIMHKGDVMDDVIEGSYRVIREASDRLNVADDMRRISVDRGVVERFASDAHRIRFGDDAGDIRTAHTLALTFPRRPEDNQPNLWALFNRTQENLIRGGIRYERTNHDARRRRNHTREVRAIDKDVFINQELWALARKYMEELG